jgi:hypothetical protein
VYFSLKIFTSIKRALASPKEIQGGKKLKKTRTRRNQEARLNILESSY